MAKLAVATPLENGGVVSDVIGVADLADEYTFDANAAITSALRIAETEPTQLFISTFSPRTELLDLDGSQAGSKVRDGVQRFVNLDESFLQFFDNSSVKTETVSCVLCLARDTSFNSAEVSSVIGVFSYSASLIPAFASLKLPPCFINLRAHCLHAADSDS